MNVGSGRLRAVLLGSVVHVGMTIVSCAPGLGSPPNVDEPTPTPPSAQVAPPPAASPATSPVAVPISAASPAPSPAASPSPHLLASPSPSPVASTSQPWQYGVGLNLDGPGAYGSLPKTSPGATLKRQLRPRPTMFWVVPGGPVRSIQTLEWQRPPIAEMRYCIATKGAVMSSNTISEGCELPDTWTPYATTQEVSVEVDWLGAGEVTARAQFRRADGTVVQSMSLDHGLIEASSSTYRAESVLGPNVPIGSLPPALQEAATARQAAFPVNGSIKVQNSACCIGAPGGSRLLVGVTLSATSPHGVVTEMRLGGGGCNPGQLESPRGEWEPFAQQRNIPITITAGRSTLTVAVQYRDAAGNLSAVACDSVGAEGMPIANKPGAP